MISEKTKIPLGWAMTIVTTLSGVIGTGAVSHYRLNMLERSWEDYQHAAELKSDTDRAQELKIQKLEITLQGIDTALNRIDARLERMENRKNGKE